MPLIRYRPPHQTVNDYLVGKELMFKFNHPFWHRILQQRRHRTLLIAFMAFVFLGVVAYATIPDPAGVIHGCYSKSGGTLRVIDDSVTQCKSGETSRIARSAGCTWADRTTGPCRSNRAYRAGGPTRTQRGHSCLQCH